MINEGTIVKSRNGTEEGKATGSTHHCRMHGCTGRRITVKWTDKSTTHPCSKGMKTNSDGSWQIL